MADPAVTPAPVDWDKILESMMKNSAQGPQDTDLPARDAIDLYSIEPLLEKDDDNFEDWHAAVMKALKVNGLQRIVESTCPRPTTGDLTSDWAYITQLVQAWLGQSMEPALLSLFTYGNERMRLADDFMKHLRKYFRGEGISAQVTAMKKLEGVQRVDFASSRDYIYKLSDYHRQAENVGLKIYPYNLVIKVIIQLQQISRLRDILYLLETRLEKDSRDDIATTMTPVEFRKLMASWLSTIGPIEAEEVYTTSNPVGESSQSCLPKAPPSGITARQHAENWIRGENQTNEKGDCAFCGGARHRAAVCYHLVPSKRPDTWKPRRGLWFLKEKAKKGRERAIWFSAL